MELSLFLCNQPSSALLHKPLSVVIPRKGLTKRNSCFFPCRCSLSASDEAAELFRFSLPPEGRRAFVGSFITAISGIYVRTVAEAVSTSRRALRGAKIPEEECTTLPNGLKYHDLKVGSGTEAVKGSRVAVRF